MAAYNLRRSHRPYTGEHTPPVASSPRYVRSGGHSGIDPMTRTLKPRESKTPEFPMAITSLQGDHNNGWESEQGTELDMQSFSHQSITAPPGFLNHFALPHHHEKSSGAMRCTLTSNFFTPDEQKRHAREHLQQVRRTGNIQTASNSGLNVKKMAKSAQIFKTRLQDSTVVSVKGKESMARAYSLLPQRPPPITPSFGTKPK